MSNDKMLLLVRFSAVNTSKVVFTRVWKAIKPTRDNGYMELTVEDVKMSEITGEGYKPLTLETSRGVIEGQYYKAEKAKSAVIYVGGVGGGFDSPANGLYARLCQDLLIDCISGLRIKYRNPLDLEEAVLDVLTGIAYLERAGVERIGLVGHSFGGAVVIQAGLLSHLVKTIVTLATQSFGTEGAKFLHGKSILSIHGGMDEILPAYCSIMVQKIAPEPKKLILIEGARHSLNQKSEEAYKDTKEWISEHLGCKTQQ